VRWEGRSLLRLARHDGRWHLVERTIDRVSDRYVEQIADVETGDVMRHVDEPLSEHRAAKRPRPPT
jgi:hypothetical protein